MNKNNCLALTQRSIAQLLSKLSESEHLETAVKNGEINLTGFITEHNIALRTSNYLVEVLKDIFKDSKTAQHIYFGHTKTTAITKHVFGDYYFENLTKILKRKEICILIRQVNRHRECEKALCHCSCSFVVVFL